MYVVYKENAVIQQKFTLTGAEYQLLRYQTLVHIYMYVV